MFGFNLFSEATVASIRRRVKGLQEGFPDLSQEELAWVLIREKCRWAAVAGCLTAVPAVLPGLGTLMAILGGALVDITILGLSITRLALELATLYGRNPSALGAQREALFAFTLAAGLHGVNKRVSTIAAAHFSKQLTSDFLERGLISLGFRASQRQFLPRILPLLGVLLAGTINYFFTRAIGVKLLNYYQKDQTSFTGKTIEARFTSERTE
jgi:uncharacterized protein (DUF697 family)